MARYLFGGRPGDFTVVDPATTSNIVTAAPSLTGGTVWSASTGGTQYTDLQTAAGSAITTVSTDSHGTLVPFKGPDAVTQVWVSFGGGTRVLIDPQGPFVQQTDAVPLATTTPASDTVAGFAGTATTASRGDHAHLLPPARPVSIRHISGQVVPMHPIGGTLSTSTLNRAFFGPIWVSTPSRAALTPTNVGVNVSTAGSAGATVRFAMWRSTSTGAIDLTSKLFESGDILSTTTGVKNYAYTTPITEGLYWVGAVMHVALCQLSASSHGMIFQGGSAGQTDDKMYLDSVTGAFTTTAPNLGGDGVPALFFTIA